MQLVAVKCRCSPARANIVNHQSGWLRVRWWKRPQVFARQCATIEPEWLLDINPDLLKRHHYDPSWQMRASRVMASERVTLFGLTISDAKRVHFGDIDKPVARQIMIRDGLVCGAFYIPSFFFKT